MPERTPSVQQLVKSYEAKQHELNSVEHPPAADGINRGKKPNAPSCGSEIKPVTGLPQRGNKIYEHS